MAERAPGHETRPSNSFSWCAWVGDDAPPMVIGRDADDALARLRAGLVTFFRDEAEIPSTEPEARAAAELDRYRANGLLCMMAPDEAAAFRCWVTISHLTAEEALLRWREVFPCPSRIDPLRRLSARLPSPAERVRRIEADSRYAVLGSTAARLPHASERRMARYKDIASQPTTG